MCITIQPYTYLYSYIPNYTALHMTIQPYAQLYSPIHDYSPIHNYTALYVH